MKDSDSVQAVVQELAFLKAQIRDNERIWSGFRDIEVRLIGADSPAEIIAVLATYLPRIFPRISAVSLAYVDSGRELSRLLGDNVNFIEVSMEELQTLYPVPWRPRLGPCAEEDSPRFFQGAGCGSVAFVPLVLRGRLVGSLNQLSLATDHFHDSDATDLLEHLAAVLAVCMENAIGRERLKRDGLTDALTGVANRRMLERRLIEETQRSLRRGEPLACLMADIDHFKAINDRFGHSAGDEVLRRVAEAMEQQLRATDVLARYGGEEFVLLLPNTNARQALAISERLRANIAALKLIPLEGRQHLSISIGVATSSVEAPLRGDELLRQADAALYEAKAAGRNCIRCAWPGITDRRKSSLE